MLLERPSQICGECECDSLFQRVGARVNGFLVVWKRSGVEGGSCSAELKGVTVS